MSHLLLIGAGFSRNWGGWLANEAFEYLLGCPTVDAGIRSLLWKHRRSGGFEAALAELQEDHRRRNTSITAQNLQNLQVPVLQMFSDMNNGFENIAFEFQTEVRFFVKTFLNRFDAIFSLNQDLLIERHYLDDRGPLGRWSGTYIPGIKPAPGAGRGPGGRHVDRSVPEAGTPSIYEGQQPFYKLHGSSNWTDGDGSQVVIIGGNKPSFIDQFPILKWSQSEFIKMLTGPMARLMVIGYSFSDSHINQMIMEGGKEHALEIFIIDPLGLDVIDEHRHNQLYTPGPLVSALQDHVIGASRRSLRADPERC